MKDILLASLDIKGTLPLSIGNFGSLSSLAMSSIKISGTIPNSIGGLTSLTSFYLDSNSLIGSIPSNIGSLNLLKSLFLQLNSLSGTIPNTMSSLTVLSGLNLGTNYLTMGKVTIVPTATFSVNTLSGTLLLENNCLAFHSDSPYPYRHIEATHCLSTSKYGLCSN